MNNVHDCPEDDMENKFSHSNVYFLELKISPNSQKFLRKLLKKIANGRTPYQTVKIIMLKLEEIMTHLVYEI